MSQHAWKKAQRYGIALQGETLFYSTDATLEHLLEFASVAPECTCFTRLPPQQFAEKLELIYQQNSGSAQLIAEDINNSDDLNTLSEEIPTNEDLLNEQSDAPVIRLINAVLSEAIKEHASDIHIEVFEKAMSIRFRVDGILRPVVQPNKKLAALLISRIKIMAKLDIAEKRLPQDGRITLKIGQRNVDVRVSTLPSQHGERVVLRLLDKSSLRLSIDKLDMSAADTHSLKNLLALPHGIILVTGPTGSGKSTTLYAILSALNSPERNVLTVEDPIEYELEGIGQTQVNSRVDMSFSRGLRAILRQDPDAVMVGEIRDNETAQIAVQASLTGHLVLSTLHTNSACGAVTRLPDKLTLPLLWVGLFFNAFFGPVSSQDAIVGAAAGYLILWLLYWLVRLICHKEGIGYGDFKMLAAVGAWCGWREVPVILYVASIAGIFYGLLLWVKKGHFGDPIPFGPALALSGWGCFCWATL